MKRCYSIKVNAVYVLCSSPKPQQTITFFIFSHKNEFNTNKTYATTFKKCDSSRIINQHVPFLLMLILVELLALQLLLRSHRISPHTFSTSPSSSSSFSCYFFSGGESVEIQSFHILRWSGSLSISEYLSNCGQMMHVSVGCWSMKLHNLSILLLCVCEGESI